MKKFLAYLPKRVNSFGIARIALIAVFVRITLAIPVHSGDLVTAGIWGIYAREFGFSGFYDFLNFGNYSRPDYPPLAIYLFWLVRIIWEGLFAFFWRINVLIPLFPSKFITWLEGEGYIFLLKLPGLIADFFVGLVIYKYLKEKFDKSKAVVGASLYWFNPAAIYVSAMWGQVDGIIVLFGLLSLIFIEQGKRIKGALYFLISILTKATMIILAPILFVKLLTKFKSLTKTLVLCITFAGLAAAPFTTENPLIWLVRNYIAKFSKAAVNLPFIQLRAYNFWTLITGFDFVPDSNLLLGLTLITWAKIISALVFIIILGVFIKKKEHWGAATLLIFASYLFLPRMHERYLLPILPFLLLFTFYYPKAKWAFFMVSTLLIFNLYAAWQVPFSFIATFLASDIPARIFSALLLTTFGWLFYFWAKKAST